MKIANLPELLIPADPLLAAAGLPYYALAKIRNLRVGEGYTLVNFAAPGFCGTTANVSATIVRERRGIYRLEAGWMAHLGKNAQRRGHLWSWAFLRLKPGRQFELVQADGPGPDVRRVSLRMVEKVLRRAVLLADWAKRSGDTAAFRAISPAFFYSRCEEDVMGLHWLERLRGPALRVN